MTDIHGPATVAPAKSSYPVKPVDDHAVYFTPDKFPVHADGVGDDAPALQQAINFVEEHYRAGIIFIPEGTYRLGSTVYLWRSIRLIGYGKQRPTFVLGENTPGYQSGDAQYIIQFCDFRQPEGEPIQDAANTTFYSGMSNINMEIRAGNPAATAVRFRVAQHSSLEHMDFFVGSGRSAVDRIGNEIEDCRFFGGQYAITTPRTSAGWQALLLDCVFDGQEVAAIESDQAGLIIVRSVFRNAPFAVRVPEGRLEELYIKDSRFENIADAGILMDDTLVPNNKANAENVGCSNVPTFLRLRKTERKFTVDAPSYVVADLSCGLHIAGAAVAEAPRENKVDFVAKPVGALPALPAKDFPELPSQETWVNIRDLGAKGDGETDDTAVFRKAVAEHKAIYMPMGFYRLTDTLELGPDTMLIGLHPSRTEFVLDADTPGFTDEAKPKALLVSPKGGRTVLTGIGTMPGRNPGVIVIHWQAGTNSLIDDVYFNRARSRGARKGEGIYYSLWIDGGGGTFKNIWSENVFAKNGWHVTNTDVPGSVYLISVEHHLTHEVELTNVCNWAFYGLQTEENMGSQGAMSIEMRDCENITFANLFMYRVMAHTEGFPYAVKISNSRGITFRGIHTFSWGPKPFDNSIFFAEKDLTVPEREVAYLTVE